MWEQAKMMIKMRQGGGDTTEGGGERGRQAVEGVEEGRGRD